MSSCGTSMSGQEVTVLFSAAVGDKFTAGIPITF